MVPIRLTTLTKTGLHRRGPAYPLQTPYDTSLSLRRPRTYDFHQTSHRWPRSVGFPLREPWYHTARPLSLRCRVPFVRAPGLDFHLLSVGHAVRTHEKVQRAVLFRSGSLARFDRAPEWSFDHSAASRNILGDLSTEWSFDHSAASHRANAASGRAGPSTIPLRHRRASQQDDAEEWWSSDHSSASSKDLR